MCRDHRRRGHPGYPALVQVVGEGRAVPKNFIHAVKSNEQALTYPVPSFLDVVTAAVDTVEPCLAVTSTHSPPTPSAARS